MRSLLLCLVLASLTLCGAAAARPLVVDDLLRLEACGPTVIDPSGRWAIIEIDAPYDRVPRFEGWGLSRTVRSHLYIEDLRHPARLRRAFPQRQAAGYIAGPFSPSGRAMVVFRDLGGRREAGVLTLASGRVLWLGVGADMGDYGATVVWRSDHALVLLGLAADDRPFQDRAQLAAMERTPGLWRRSLSGRRATAIVQGSGRFSALHPVEPPRRLLSIAADTGEKTVLARGDFESLSLAPDRRVLALVEDGARLQDSPDTLIAPGSEWRRHGVSRLALGSHRLRRLCAPCDVMPGSLRWSQRGDLLFYAKAPSAAWDQGRLMRAAASDDDAVAVDTGGVGVAFSYAGQLVLPVIHADWLGDDPMLYGRAPGSAPGRADWYRLDGHGAVKLTAALPSPPPILGAIAGDTMLMVDAGAVWAVDAVGGARPVLRADGLKRLAAIDPYTTVQAPIDAPGAGYATVVTASGGLTDVAGIGPSGVAWTIKLAADASAPPVGGDAAAPGHRTILAASTAGAVTLTRDVHGVGRLKLASANGATRRLATLNPQLAQIDWARPIPISDPAPTGEPLTDWLYLPKGAKVSDRLPLVVVGYPGATHRTAPYNGEPGVFLLDDNPQLVVGHGFAALLPSVPAPKDGPLLGSDLAARVLRAVDLAARLGFVDPHRVAYWGHSGGAYMGLQLATQTDRFRAIVATAGVYDLISARGQVRPSWWLGPDWPVGEAFSQGWSERGQGHLLATPWTNRDRYIRNSPLFAADRITTPVLLVQGDQDVVGLAQGQEMFSALYRLRKDALLMTIFGEGHTISSPPNVRAYMRAAFRFLDENLGWRIP